jgi:hypothetical protein
MEPNQGSDQQEAVTLYRPVGQQELDLIRESGFRAFPPRLAWQPIFYPVLTEEYAARIAREWNTKDPASGFVGYEPKIVGGEACREYWIPAGELEAFNRSIVGPIEIIAEYRPETP